MMAAASRDGDLQLAIGASSILNEICWANQHLTAVGAGMNWKDPLRMVPTDGWLQSSTGCSGLSCFFSFFSRLAEEWPLEPKLWLYTEFA